MRRTFLAMGVVCLAGSSWLIACGSDAANIIAANGGDGDAGGDGSTTGGDAGGGDGGGATDSGSGGDGGTVVLPDGGTTPNPGAVTCGPSLSCNAGSFCCADPTDGGFSCQTSGGACPNGGQLRCDEAADCTLPDGGPMQCCLEVTDNVVSSSCHLDCKGGGGDRVTACKTQAACSSGTCAVHTCTNGQTVEACGPVGDLCP